MLKEVIITRQEKEIIVRSYYEGDLGIAEQVQAFYITEIKSLSTAMQELLALIHE